MMWFFWHFWIFISYHIFLLNQVEGAIAIPPSNRAPLPLFCLSVCPSVCPSIGLLTTFSCFYTFADKSLGRNGIELEMQMFPDDLPLANIDADGYCHFMRSSVRPTIHGLGFVYCIQSAWKKWPTIWHADVSRWLTLGTGGCYTQRAGMWAACQNNDSVKCVFVCVINSWFCCHYPRIKTMYWTPYLSLAFFVLSACQCIFVLETVSNFRR